VQTAKQLFDINVKEKKMLARLFLAIGMFGGALSTTDLVSPMSIAGVLVNIASASDSGSEDQSIGNSDSGKTQGIATAHPRKTESGDLLLISQVLWATACYTFAGPVCPMRVLTPLGSPCTCYFPNTPPLAGIAQ
jgi:hypothetical protein